MSHMDELDKIRDRLIAALNANDRQGQEIYMAAIRAFYDAHPDVVEDLENAKLARVRG